MFPTPISYCVPINGSPEGIRYEGLFIRNPNQRKTHCILLLSGTSTQLSDVSYFISCLFDRGYAVASIERFIGGPFSIRIKPDIERKEALKHFIRQLRENYQIEQFEIIAHSYASFEVIRLLMDDPEMYKKHLRSIIFINPAGFKEDIGFIPHCLRFTFIFILKEYAHVLMYFLKRGRGDTFTRDFYTKKLHATNSLFIKTIQNPVKTLKEVADIVSFKLKPIIKELIEQHGYRFYFVLNTGDELVDVSQTFQQVQNLLPENRIISFPGNHMDLLIHKGQIDNFINILDNIVENK